MTFTDIFIRRPVLAIVVNLVIVIAGLQAVRSLNVRQYPRLMCHPTSLQPEEMLSAIVERLLKAMRSVHPKSPRQFFALANRHMRWELNDLARRLDQRTQVQGLLEDAVPFPETSGSALSPNATRMLATTTSPWPSSSGRPSPR